MVCTQHEQWPECTKKPLITAPSIGSLLWSSQQLSMIHSPPPPPMQLMSSFHFGNLSFEGIHLLIRKDD
jgi:hypothetical protein